MLIPYWRVKWEMWVVKVVKGKENGTERHERCKKEAMTEE